QPFAAPKNCSFRPGDSSSGAGVPFHSATTSPAARNASAPEPASAGPSTGGGDGGGGGAGAGAEPPPPPATRTEAAMPGRQTTTRGGARRARMNDASLAVT